MKPAMKPGRYRMRLSRFPAIASAAAVYLSRAPAHRYDVGDSWRSGDFWRCLTGGWP